MSNRLRKHASRHYASGLDPLTGLTYDQIVGAMVTDLDVGIRDNASIYLDDGKIKFDKNTQMFALRNRADNAWYPIRAKVLEAVEGWAALGTPAYIRTLGQNTGVINFLSFATGWKTTAIMQLGHFEIPRLGDVTFLADKKLVHSEGSELTIASGEITAVGSFHIVDTEDDDPADDLVTINGGVIGMTLILRTADSARDVTLKDATGNLQLAGDCTLATKRDMITLVFTMSVWVELSRSING